MAVIQYSGLVSQVRGKIAGTVFSKYSTGFNVYRSPVQRLTPTAAQLRQRSGFSANAYTWNALTTEEKEDWTTLADAHPQTNKFGDVVTFTGYQFYRLFISLCFPEGLATPIIADLSPGDVLEFTAEAISLDIENTGTGSQITGLEIDLTTINDSGSANQVIAWISQPMTSADNRYFGTYYRIGSFEIPANPGAAAVVPISFVNEAMAPAWRSFDGAKHRIKLQSTIPLKGEKSVIVFADSEASGVPVVIFPSFEYDGAAGISVGGPGEGIWDYYWLSAESTAIKAGFTLETQWAAAQVSITPVDPGDWFAGLASAINPGGSSSIFIPTAPASPNQWYDPWFTDIGPTLVGTTMNYAPIRARLIDIATDEAGPWTEGYFLIFYS